MCMCVRLVCLYSVAVFHFADYPTITSNKEHVIAPRVNVEDLGIRQIQFK